MKSTLLTTKDGKKIKVVIDESKCIGAASCVALASSTFTLQNNIAHIIENSLYDDLASLQMAATSCPVFAISIFDEEDNKIS